MTDEQFKRLQYQCRKSDVSFYETFSYSTVHFGNTFLPYVRRFKTENLITYDGAEVYNKFDKLDNIYLLEDDKKPANLMIYTSVTGTDAVKNKLKINVGTSEVYIFKEVNKDESVNVFVQIGSSVKKSLQAFAKKHDIVIRWPEIDKPFIKTDVKKLKDDFHNDIDHQSVMKYLLKAMGVTDDIIDNGALQVRINDIKVRESKLSDEDKEQDIIIEFSTNKKIKGYSLQVLEDQKIIYEKEYLKSPKSKEQSFENNLFKVVWDCSKNKTFEEKSPKRKITFNIDVWDNKGRKAITEQEIKLKEYIEKNKKTYNNVEYNKNRVIVWLKENYTPAKELMPNLEELPIEVFEGAKLVRLRPQKDSIFTPCLFWWNNKYHIQEFPEELLIDTNEVLGDYVGAVFQNDIAHAAHRSTFLEKQIEITSYRDYSEPNLGKLSNILFKEARVQYDNAFLKSKFLDFKHHFQADLDNKVETINRLLLKVREFYDPENLPGKKVFDQVLFVPLSQDWFNRYDDDVKIRYNDYWIKESGFNALQYESGGEVFGTNFMNEVLSEIFSFTNLSVFKTINSERILSGEWQWIIQLQTEDTSKYKKMVLFCLNAWSSTEKDSFASGIGLEQTFGIFRMPAFMTVMVHESAQDVQPAPFPIDSHTRDTEGHWGELSANYGVFKDDEVSLTSSFYIADFQIATIFAHILLKFLKS